VKTADLIDRLASDFKGSVRLRPAWKKAAATLATTALIGEAIFLFFHIRPDLGGEARELQFILSGSALLASWLVFSWALSLLATPGRQAKSAVVVGALAVGLLVAGFFVQAVCVRSLMAMSAGLNPSGIRCSLDVLLISLPPAAVTLYRLRKGAPVRLALTGAVIGLVCASLGAFALQFSCANDHPIHLLTWHIVLPHLGMGGVGAWAAQRFLRW
jgi:hypothetical protein